MMMTGRDEITWLREAFAACDSPAVEGCPPPEMIWEALRGELPPDEVREVVDHTSACATCAADWRLAHAFEKQSADAIAVPDAAVGRTRFRTLQPWLAAAAAAVVLVVGVRWSEWWMPREESVYRDGTEQAAIRSLIPEDQPLPRQRFLLEWEGPEGASYDIWVSTEKGMELIARQSELTTPTYQVPASALEALPASTRLLWQVEAVLPDGSRVTSITFVAMLE